MDTHVPTYTKLYLPSQAGTIKLTVFGPDAEWVEEQVRPLVDSLPSVKSAMIHVGPECIFLDRDRGCIEMSFFVQCYRSIEDPWAIPELEVTEEYYVTWR